MGLRDSRECGCISMGKKERADDTAVWRVEAFICCLRKCYETESGSGIVVRRDGFKKSNSEVCAICCPMMLKKARKGGNAGSSFLSIRPFKDAVYIQQHRSLQNSPPPRARGIRAVESWSVYIVRCVDGSLYTGIAKDVARRVDEHNANNLLAANYTRARRPVSLVYSEVVATRSAAGKREYEIKCMSREEKETLIGLRKKMIRRKHA